MFMRRPFIAGNWKMNTTSREARELLEGIKKGLGNEKKADVAVCPPFPYLMMASEILQGTEIRLGAQNMHWEDNGAYTGEVSVSILMDSGCEFVILGHSERRAIFGETDEGVLLKIQKAVASGLKPIVCVGELLEHREAGRTEEIIGAQIEGSLGRLSKDEMLQVTVAYEPVWAIGTGKTATPQQAQDVHQWIRQWLKGKWDQTVADTVRIQYGGSVKPGNAESLLGQTDIDGALVGGASLSSAAFIEIVNSSHSG
jgi:triosephosphate isomerase